jgi:hypothetical protein
VPSATCSREQLTRLYLSAVADFDRLVFDLYELTDDEQLVVRST